MPTNYRFRDPNSSYQYDFLFDDVFVPAYIFQQGNLWAWGSNTYGQLGDNTTTSRSTPVTTFIGGINWKQVGVSADNAAGIKNDGTLWTWGRNNRGQLGVNDTIDRSTPVTTFAGGNNWKQLYVGTQSMGAIKTDGTLWTWGLNVLYGTLGDNTTTNRSTPVTTFAGGNDWKQFATSSGACAAIKNDGTLWVWGSNQFNQLGDGTSNNALTPITTFAGGNNWKQIAGGGNNNFAAIKNDGTLWVWGGNINGSLGDNTSTNRCTPVTTFAGGNDWLKSYEGSAIKTDGTLWVWGSQPVGDNTTTNRSTPVTTFAGGSGWRDVCGKVAIKGDGTLWTWGDVLGNNTSSTSLTPVTTSLGGSNWLQSFSSGAGGSTLAVTYVDTYQ